MSDRPKSGGRYVRDDAGKLTRVSYTSPPSPGQPAARQAPAATAPKPAPKKKEG